MFPLRHVLPLLWISTCAIMVHGNTIYKYQDANGKWHFTDKKPASVQADKVSYQQRSSLQRQPYLDIREINGQWSLLAVNPFYAPLEVAVKLHDGAGGTVHRMVQANSEALIHAPVSPSSRYEHALVPGDPSAKPDNSRYLLPVRRNIQHFISQSFSGQFSHREEPNVYAVDIGLPVGSEILAARAGTVMHVQDAYVMDGTNEYFIDKANIVKVLHSDGTIAVYAHLLAGGAKVSPGQQVQAGDVLALSGSTGFSTGPHLHFVIWRNTGLRYVSVPFRFSEAGTPSWLPAAGMVLEP